MIRVEIDCRDVIVAFYLLKVHCLHGIDIVDIQFALTGVSHLDVSKILTMQE